MRGRGGTGPSSRGVPVVSWLTPRCPRRLVELAPQYYLSNLPPSEGRDLLMELREKVAAAEEAPAEPELAQAAGGEDEHGDVCVLQ